MQKPSFKMPSHCLSGKPNRVIFWVLIFLALRVLTLTTKGYTEDKTKKSTQALTQPKTQKAKVIYDLWYTIEVAGMPYAYYQDKAEDRGDKIHYQNHLYKLEEGFLNEEHLGGLAEDNPLLTPLFFNFNATYRASQVEVNGNIVNNIANITINKNGTTSPQPIKKPITKGTILSIFFPLFIKYKIDSIKQNQYETLMAVHEDGEDGIFDTYHGKMRLDTPDKFSKKTQTKKIVLDYRDMKTFWYVDNKGLPIRITSPSRQMLTEISTESKAKAYLKNTK